MTRAMMNAKRSKLPKLQPCPAKSQEGICQGFEACYARLPGSPCPFECDACGDVSADVDDEGLCENCSMQEDGGE
jgi:hypothetical protein